MGAAFKGFFRRRPAPQPHQPSEPQSEPIELLVFTAAETFTMVGVVQPKARMTDWLNSPDEIRGRRAAESDGTEVWTSLDRSQCLVVVPPVAATDPKLRLHRPKQRIVVRLGPITVTGAASVPAGTEATAFLRRHGKPFLPLTDVTIDSSGGPGSSAEVAIVHLALADRVAPVTVFADRSGGPHSQT